MSFPTLDAILKKSQQEHTSFWETILEEERNERQESKEACFERMALLYDAMKQADAHYDGGLKSTSKMVGGDGLLLEQYNRTETLTGDMISLVMEKAIKMGESNACMKRIVAAPTAGSCGVIPATFLSYGQLKKKDDNLMVQALFVSAGIGSVIANLASISGAEGGCQAEIGSASAMAAGGIAYLEGGDNECIAHAAALALKSMLGLTCDPVAGLVEVPCVKRNVLGGVNAMTSAQMALAGIRSAIPPDEVITTMGEIGRLLPSSLRETGEGGLAITPTAQKITKQLS